MDNKYIENLGMCNQVDEGLWDRLKSRAVGYAQAGKNILGKGTTEMQAAQFSSLFKKFLNNSISTIKDFYRVMVPFVNAGKATPEEKQQIDDIVSLSWSIQDIQDIGSVPITEANLFTRPFSVLGAQASGKVQNIIDAYKKLLRTHYESFINDAKKLNIVPAEYITRKIGATFPAAKDFIDKIETVTGYKTSTKPAPIPASPAPVAPSGPEKPTDVPVASIPASPTVPSAAPVPSTSAPVTPTPAPTVPPVLSPGKSSLLLADNHPEKLGWMAVYKILNLLSPDGKMLDDIHSYIRRDASKAEVPFPANPALDIKSDDGEIIKLHMRYKAVKSISGHAIQIHLEKKTKDPSGKTISQRAPRWEEFIKFAPSDVITMDGKLNTSFDLLKNIDRNNPAVAKKMDDVDPDVLPEINRKMVEALASIVEASVPDNERGKRRLGGDKAEEPLPGHEKETPGLEPPPGGPKAPTPSSGTGPVPPEAKGRTTTTGIVPPRPPSGGELTFDKLEKEKAAKKESFRKKENIEFEKTGRIWNSY